MKIYFNDCYMYKVNKYTSSDVCGQVNQLLELLVVEEPAQLIGVLDCTLVEISNDQCGLFKVDELLQNTCSPEQRFFLRSIDRDYIQI